MLCGHLRRRVGRPPRHRLLHRQLASDLGQAGRAAGTLVFNWRRGFKVEKGDVSKPGQEEQAGQEEKFLPPRAHKFLFVSHQAKEGEKKETCFLLALHWPLKQYDGIHSSMEVDLPFRNMYLPIRMFAKNSSSFLPSWLTKWASSSGKSRPRLTQKFTKRSL